MSSATAHEPASGSTSTKAAARVADLFERHGRMVYGICRAMLRQAEEAEDATQQAFLSAHRAFLGGARVRDEGAWIATIARNECRARISAGMRTPASVGDEDLGDIPHGVDEVERRFQASELCDALAELPQRQREAVVLRYVYGLRYGEVAKALGLSRPATEALLFRARRAMRVRLRHAFGTALAVPLSVREELALALPGFDAQTGSGAAAAGLTGGLLAKLASAPAAAKLATATVAVSTVGAVGVVESDQPAPGARAEIRLATEPESAAVAYGLARGSGGGGDDESGPSDGQSGRGGSEERSGPRESDDGDRQGRDEGSSHGSDAESRETSGRSGSGSDSGDDEPSGDAIESVAERADSTGPGSDEAQEDDRSGSPEEPSESSGSSGSGGDSSEEPDDDSGHGSSSSGSGGDPDDEADDVAP